MQLYDQLWLFAQSVVLNYSSLEQKYIYIYIYMFISVINQIDAQNCVLQ